MHRKGHAKGGRIAIGQGEFSIININMKTPAGLTYKIANSCGSFVFGIKLFNATHTPYRL
jgi:hypothetical protein